MPLIRTHAAQHIDHTTSRHTGPRRWLRAVTWMLNAGHHPHATNTTLRIAEDLADRMDYDLGHVRYAIDLTIERTGLSRSCVTTHVKYLREMGLLAWVVRGSRTNIRRLLGHGGYAGTATVYAAVIPPAYDHAMGHRIDGSGYRARAVIDYRTMPKPVDTPPQGTGTNPRSGSSWTPSLTVVKKSGSVQVESGFTTTGEPDANNSTPSTHTPKNANSSRAAAPRRKRRTILGRTVTAAGMNRGHRLAQALRRALPWTRRATHNQLRWVCADMAEQQWTERQAVDFAATAASLARGAGLLWQPDRPQHLIARALLQDAQQQDHTQPMTAAQWADYHAQQAALQAAEEATHAAIQAERTDDDRRTARQAARYDLRIVADHLTDHGPDDAIDLYGAYLTAKADRLLTSPNYRMGA